MATMQMPMMKARMWEAQKAAQAGRLAEKAAQAKMSTPWAVIGMIAAFAGGALIGMFGTKKTLATSTESGERWRMMKHHHHGFGEGACRHKHGESGMAAPGATPGEARNEGE